MKNLMRLFWICVAGGLFSATALAQLQDSCEVDKQVAVAEAQLWCAELGLGSACYGNGSLSVTGAAADSFRLPGDQIALADVDALGGQYLASAWPIALFDVAAYPDNSWVPAPVRLLLFGEAQLQNNGTENRTVQAETLAISASQGANLRSGPTTEYRLLQAIFEGDLVKATGRLSDFSWLRVQLPDGRSGWLNASAVAAVPDTLPEVTLESESVEALSAPFQRFTLRTTTPADCATWPQSGVMLQSPESTMLSFEVNGLSFSLSGTAFLRVEAADDGTERLIVSVLDGEILPQGADLPERIEAGYDLRYPLGDSEELPRRIAYDYSRMISLPTELMPRFVYAALDLRTIVRPSTGVNPIATLLVNDACTITTGPGGSNLRGGPGPDYPVRGVLAYWESAQPTGRATGADGSLWWQLTARLWVRADTTVTGGDCVSVPTVSLPPPPR